MFGVEIPPVYIPLGEVSVNSCTSSCTVMLNEVDETPWGQTNMERLVDTVPLPWKKDGEN